MACTSARSSLSSARRDGIGVPPSPLCASAVEEAKPTAPAAIDSRTSVAIFAISSSVAVRSVASSPITKVRIAEWPAKQATLGPTPCFSSMSRYCGKLSKPQLMPARSASSDMPSTCVRCRMVRSRSWGLQGAMVKPQLPSTAVVTPSAGEGSTNGSQVICAS